MKQGNKKALILGIVGVVLAILLVAAVAILVIPQFGASGSQAGNADPTETTATQVLDYDLYWNLDRAEYEGKSEGGMSARVQESDGFFTIRFLLDGEVVSLRTADRRLVNAIDSQSLMGL